MHRTRDWFRRRSPAGQEDSQVTVRSNESQIPSTGRRDNAAQHHHSVQPPAYGLKLLYESTEAPPNVDIVAVHGLNGHRESTWTSDGGKLWLRDFLPSKISNARIYSWGYDANTHSGDRVNTQYIYDIAKTLVSDLSLERQLTNTEQRPIIFVAHSLGGLVVKSALIHADSARSGHLHEHRAIKVSTSGIFFLGTPHQGGQGVSMGQILANIASTFMHTNRRVVDNLKEHSEWLEQQLGQYNAISRDFKTKFGYETYETPILLGSSILVVPKYSAVVPGAVDAEEVAILANHIQMTKFGTVEDAEFLKVANRLLLMARSAVQHVEQNWQRELQTDTMQKLSEMNPAENSFRVLVQPHQMIPESIDHKASKFSDALKWLSYPEMSVRDTVVRDADPGTLAWVADRAMPLGKWFQAGTGVFWVKGKPGSGKSTLMKHLHQISKPRGRAYGEAAQCDHSMAFFFSNSGAPIERSVEGLLRFMLYQLLASAPTRYVKIRRHFELWFIDGKVEMSKEKLQYLISEFLDGEGNLPSFLIFIDALDECEMLTREDVSFLQALGTKFAPKVRFCVSSRPSAMLFAQLIHAPQCDVNETVSTDIAIYIKSRLQAACDSDPGIFFKLSEDIVQSASGVFLWVKLVVEELSRGFDGGETVEELRARLSKVPSELDQYFRRMLDRIGTTYRRDALVAINIICTAIRPLSVNEFRYALMLGMTPRARDLRDLDQADWAIRTNAEMQKRLLTRYGGFAEIVNDEVRLIHYSIKEFFTLSDSAVSSGSPVNVVDSQIPQHQFLLRSCTRYLCLPELKATEDGPRMDTPLLMYAIQYWFMHYREASADGSLNLSEIWCFFDPARKYFQNWDRLYPRTLNSSIQWLRGRHDDETNVMCFAAQHNLFELMEGLIAAGVDVNIHGGELGRPLQAAVVEDHLEMARLLVDNGADVNAEGGRFGTAMAAAITLKNQRMIDFLLENKADVTLSTPLSPAPCLKWNGYRHDFSRHQADKTTFGQFSRRFLAPPPGVEGASAPPVFRFGSSQHIFYRDKSGLNLMSGHNDARSELPQHSSSFSHSADDDNQEAMDYEQD